MFRREAHAAWLVRALTLGLLAVTLPLTTRGLYGPPGALVNVRWQPSVDAAERQRIERGLLLVDGLEVSPSTWRYNLTAPFENHIRAIVEHPAVADTHRIDRTRYTLDPEAIRTARRHGLITVGGNVAVGIVDGLATILALLAGLSVLVRRPMKVSRIDANRRDILPPHQRVILDHGTQTSVNRGFFTSILISRLVVSGLVCWALAGTAYAVLRLTFGDRPVRIHVQWAPTVGDAARLQLERRYRLAGFEPREDRTFGYALTDRSYDNIRNLVLDPAVGDTHEIDRIAFRVESSAPRLPYGTPNPGMPVGLEVLSVLGFLGGLTSISLGLLERAVPGAVNKAIAQLMAVAKTLKTKSRNNFAVLWSVLIIVSALFALMIYELPHVYPAVQSENWWEFLTPETWSRSSIKELGLWENVTAVSFFVSGVILIATSVVRPVGASNSMCVPFLFGVVYLVVAAEEISFGQHFLGFTAPEAVRSLNNQGETNFHNVFSDDINYYAVFLVFYGYIGVFPIIATYNQIVRTLTLHLNIPKPPIAFAKIMIPVFIVFSADLFIGRENAACSVLGRFVSSCLL